MLHAQQIWPVKGDWFSSVQQIMEDMLISIDMEDIQKMIRR